MDPTILTSSHWTLPRSSSKPEFTMNLTLLLLLLLGASLSSSAPASHPQCMDESGKPVDWYIIYKFPYLPHLHNPLFGGYRYAILSSSAPDGWHLSEHNITDTKGSIFAHTLASVYGSGASKISTVFYNDQPPEGEAPSHFAHSKGAVVGDEKQGFWLIHTVPHFAPGEGSYSYVASGGRFGQVAMCISLANAELEKVISENFLTSQPFVYHTHIATASGPFGAALEKLKAKSWITTKSYAHVNLTSLGGQHFASFYKSPGDHVDLYADIVAPAFKSSLFVETWRKNPGTPLNSECTHPKTTVENVDKIAVSFVNSSEKGSFSYMEDHSKWAISGTTSGGSHVCIGDINRMHSQFKRGGGTTCISVPSVWKAFKSFVGETEKCT